MLASNREEVNAGRIRQGIHGGDELVDLTAAIVGSEGMFGIVTKALVRLTPLPQSVSVMLAAFGSMEDVASAVTNIIATGKIEARSMFGNAKKMLEDRSIDLVELDER